VRDWLTNGKGWGGSTAAILLLTLGFAAGAGYLVSSQYRARKKQKPRLPHRLRVLLFAVGFSCATVGFVAIAWNDVGKWALRSSVKIGSERALAWSLETWKTKNSVIDVVTDALVE